MGNVKVQKRKVQFRICKRTVKIRDKEHEKKKKGLYRYRKEVTINTE